MTRLKTGFAKYEKKRLKSVPVHKKMFKKPKNVRWHFCVTLTNGSLLRDPPPAWTRPLRSAAGRTAVRTAGLAASDPPPAGPRLLRSPRPAISSPPCQPPILTIRPLSVRSRLRRPLSLRLSSAVARSPVLNRQSGRNFRLPPPRGRLSVHSRV